MAFSRTGIALITVLCLGASTVNATTSFQDVAQGLGLTETDISFGAAWADVNNDGRMDVWMGNHNKPAKLYINDPDNGFVPYTNFVGLVSADMHGAAWADFDNDGDQDLMISVGAQVGAGVGPNLLFVNNGTQLVESAVSYGVDYELARGRHVAWLDWNNDSYLDLLFVAENSRPTPPQAPSLMYTYNSSTASFEAEPFPVHRKNATNFAQLMLTNPLLNDQPALLVTQEASDWPDNIYTYDSNGLTTVTSAFAFPDLGFVRDVVPGDFDNDGQVDLIIVDQSSITHMRQQSSGMVDVTASSGFDSDRNVFAVSADFDNDKDLDLYVARGHINQDFNMVNELYYNNGDGTFTKAPNASGASGTTTGFISGATVSDYNNDGFVDLLVTNSDNWFTPAVTGPIQLFENQPNSNNWLKIHLVGTLSNRDAVGAKVFLTSGGVTQLREQNGGTHHRSQDDRRLHFGLASDPLATLVEVHWPNGDIQTFSNATPNQTLVIHQSNPSVANLPPIASLSSEIGSNSFTVELSSAQSIDPDGIIASVSWDFGDGTTSTEKSPTHTYAATGNYTVTLTVTDDMGATDTATISFAAEIEATIEAVGANPQTSSRLIDTNPDGSDDLSTFWSNDNQLSTAWVTLDIGEAIDVDQVLIAPRGDINYDFDITVGNNLLNGEVVGPVTTTCSTPGGGAQVPSAPAVCTVPPTNGRYVTVRSTNRISLRIYTLKALALGITNVSPLPAFTATPDSSGITVDFDANASTDAEGPISAFNWDFGDGTTDSGATPSHSYAASGSYVITLTVVDSAGGSNSTSAEITLTAPTGPSQLAATVEAVGQTNGQQANIIDESAPGVQDLSTKWENGNGALSAAWFTLDLGSEQVISRVDLAPRGNLSYGLQIRVSNTINGAGQTTGGMSVNCTVPAGTTLVPSTMHPCSVADFSGRYVMVKSRFRGRLPMHGAAVFGPAGTGGPSNNTPPIAVFSATQIEDTLNVDFNGSSSTDPDGMLVNHVWDFGDGSSTNSTSTTTHSYASDESVLVSLAVTDDGGAISVVSDHLDLEAPSPNPIFQQQPQSVTVDEGAAATFTAFAAGSQPITYQWRLNGNNILGATQASYTINSAGAAQSGEQYDIVASNSNGSTSSTIAVLTVTPSNTPPTASLSIDSTSGDAPLSVNLDGSASSDSDGTIVSYDWDFGDGSSASGAQVSKVFEAGNFTVTLSVTDDDGATSQTTTTVSVNALPIASFSATPITGTAPLTVELDGSASIDPDGSITSYAWDFGDGSSANTVTASHDYTSDGNYTVVLTVIDNLGATQSTSQTVTVTVPLPPTITSQPQSISIIEGESTTFTVTAEGNAVLTYQWRLNGVDISGANASSYSVNNAQLTDSGNSYSVAVTSPGGTTVSSPALLTVELPNQVPVAAFSSSPTAAPLTKVFDASASLDNDGVISTYAWNFGDGNIASGVNPIHSYATSGSFTVTLTVTDDDGATDSTSEILLANGAPVAAFSLTPDTGVAALQVTADATTSTDVDGTIATYSWDFGDGNTASGPQPSNLFVNPGSYTVELTVTDNLGAANSATQTIVVAAPVPPSITTQPVDQTAVENSAVTFAVAADGTAPLSFQWLRDGTPINGANASTYSLDPALAADDAATFSAIVTNVAGMATSSEAILTVLLPPTITSQPNSATVNPGDSTAFSTSATGSAPISYQWQRDGANIPGATNATFVFSNAQPSDTGSAIRAVITNPAGTVTTESAILNVNPENVAPTAAFAITEIEGSLQRDFDASSSSDTDGNITSYAWDFGDGGIGSGLLTSHTYSEPGTYLVTLTITDDDGATDTFSLATTTTVPATIISSGSAGTNQDTADILDTLPSGEQNLATFWQNNNGSANAWFTIDLGSEQIVDEVRIGVRSDSANRLNFHVGNVLSNGRVTGSVDGTCRTDPLGVIVPPALVSCALTNPTSGRYVTVSRLYRDLFRVYGAEVGVVHPNTPPKAAFGAMVMNATRTVQADASASTDNEGSIASYLWDFGDGSTSSGSTATHTYAADGSYSLSLTVTDSDGASDSATQTLSTVALAPIREISTTVASVGGNAAVQNSITDVKGDGSQDLATAWDNGGALSTAWFTLDLATEQVLRELHIATRGDAIAELDIVIGNTLANGQVVGGITTLCSTPGVDGPVPSLSHVCIVPNLGGRYVTVAATNLAPLTVHGVSAWIEDTPENFAPVASFSASQSANSLEVAFDGGSSTDVDGVITNFLWDFGDGGSSTDAAPAYTYAAAGNYSVTLTVTDDDLATNSTSQTVTVAPVPMPPVITTQPVDQSVNEGETATFSVTATGIPAPTYQWNRNGVSLPGANAPSYTTASTTAGESGDLYTVTVSNTVASITSAAASLLVTTLPNQPPVAGFSASAEADGVTFNFNASGSTDSDGTITSYSWDFGDGSSGVGVTTTHAYSTDGIYSVTLTVIDDDGSSDSTSSNVTAETVSGGEPTRAAVSVHAVPANNFKRNRAIDEKPSGDQLLTNYWNGNSNVNSGWITLDLGASDLVSEIRVAPRGDRSHSVEITVGDSLTSNQVSGASIHTCQVDAIGTTAAPLTLTQCPISATNGRYVTVRVPNEGFVRFYGIEVYVGAGGPPPANSPPVASLTATPVANTLMANFSAANSTDSDGVIVEYQWDFGDGNTTNTTNPSVSHTYAAAGSYVATVSVVDDDNDTGSATAEITVDASTGGPGKINIAVANAGGALSTTNLAFDETANGDQDLNTFWRNSPSGVPVAWITFDLGSVQNVGELRVAPHGSRAYNLGIYIGNNLVGGRVDGPETFVCSLPGGSVPKPSALTTCATPVTAGRYLTIQSKNFGLLRLYGVEVYSQ